MEQLQTNIKRSRARRLVPDDKFDRHMKRARLQDINSRKSIFCQTTEQGEAVRQRIQEITPSTY